MRRTFLCLAVLASVTLCHAQDVSSPPGDNPAKTPDKKTAEYFEPSQPIKVSVEQQFAVQLKSNPTTGYGWQLARPLDEKILALVTNIYVHKQIEKRVGVGGIEIWTFRAVGRGRAEISMKYVRSWEKGKPPIRTNIFTVIVK